MSIFVRYIHKDTVIHRLSPLTKIFFLGAIWVTSFLTYHPYTLAVLIAFNIGLWLLARVPYLWARFKIILLTVSVVTLMWTLFFGFFHRNIGENPHYLFSYGDLHFSLEGMTFGIMMTLKVLSIVTIIPIIMWTSPLSKFMAALSKIKVPYMFVFILSTAFRFMPLIDTTFSEIVDSQKLRGHDIDSMDIFTKIMKGYVPIAVPLSLSLLRGSEDLQVAIETRAYGAPVVRTFVEEITLKKRDYIAIIVTLALVAGIMWYSIITGTTNPMGLQTAIVYK